MKILLAISNYGDRHEDYLQAIIEEFRAMPFEVDVVTFSSFEKEMGPDVTVRVMPKGDDPRALPFSYKRLFIEAKSDYDLFIYCEDDTLIKRHNVEAFLSTAKLLPKDEVPGFIRYELDENGKMFYSSIHAHMHWDPQSIKKAGGEVFAYLTNEHAACFMLTRDQLGRAIDSGGFDLGPREGRYAMLETAATDPYTVCGLRKMICISRLDDFRIHHLPNSYINRLGVSSEEVHRQLQVAGEIAEGKQSGEKLFEPSAGLESRAWDKIFYEPKREDILRHIPSGAKNVLSLACGSGETEAALVDLGIHVVGVPMDRIIASMAEPRGIEMMPPNFEEARKLLEGRQFEAILFSEGLHLLKDPGAILGQFAPLLAEGGVFIAGVPNFKHLRILLGDLASEPSVQDYRFTEPTHLPQFSRTTRSQLRDWMGQAGLKTNGATWNVTGRWKLPSRASLGLLDEWVANGVLLVGRR